MVQTETSPVPMNLRTLRCWNEGGVGIVLIDDNGKCSKYIYIIPVMKSVQGLKTASPFFPDLLRLGV